MATKRISAKQLKDLAFRYTTLINTNRESPAIFEFTEWVEKELKSPLQAKK